MSPADAAFEAQKEITESIKYEKLLKRRQKLLQVAAIKKLLVDQIFSTVRWRERLIEMIKAGIKNFIEIGPGKALSGMVKRTLKAVNSFSINSIADIKNLQNELKK